MENSKTTHSNDSDSDKMDENEYEDESEVDINEEVTCNPNVAHNQPIQSETTHLENYSQEEHLALTQAIPTTSRLGWQNYEDPIQPIPTSSRLGWQDYGAPIESTSASSRFGCRDYDDLMPPRRDVDPYCSDRYRPRRPVTINARRNRIGFCRDQEVGNWSNFSSLNHPSFNVCTSTDYNSLSRSSNQVCSNGGPHTMLPSFASAFGKQSYAPHAYTTPAQPSTDMISTQQNFSLPQEPNNIEPFSRDNLQYNDEWNTIARYEQNNVSRTDAVEEPATHEIIENIPIPTSFNHQYNKPQENSSLYLESNGTASSTRDNQRLELLMNLNRTIARYQWEYDNLAATEQEPAAHDINANVQIPISSSSHQYNYDTQIPLQENVFFPQQPYLGQASSLHDNTYQSCFTSAVSADTMSALNNFVDEKLMECENRNRFENQVTQNIGENVEIPAILPSPAISYHNITISSDSICPSSSDSTSTCSTIDVDPLLPKLIPLCNFQNSVMQTPPMNIPTHLSNRFDLEVNPTENDPAPFEQLVLEANNAVNPFDSNDHAVTRLIKNNPNLLLLRTSNAIIIAHPDFLEEQENDLFGPNNQWIPINQVDSGKLPNLEKGR